MPARSLTFIAMRSLWFKSSTAWSSSFRGQRGKVTRENLLGVTTSNRSLAFTVHANHFAILTCIGQTTPYTLICGNFFEKHYALFIGTEGVLLLFAKR
jgi:hypothetical protein